MTPNEDSIFMNFTLILIIKVSYFLSTACFFAVSIYFRLEFDELVSLW